MNFTITINGEGAELGQALKTLREVMDGKGITEGAVTATIETPKRKTAKPEPVKEEAPLPEPEPERSVDDMAYDLVNGLREAILADGQSDEPIPSDVELREVAASKGKDGKRAGIKALLDTYGAPNITAVPAEKRIAFKRELEAL